MKIQSPSIATKLVVSGSFDLTSTSKTSLVNQITGSLNTLYTQSGSVSQASWGTLQNKPSGIISSSNQISSSIGSSVNTVYTFPNFVILNKPVISKYTQYNGTFNGVQEIKVLEAGDITFYDSNAANNWTLNIIGNSETTFTSIIDTSQTIKIRLVVNNSTTGYYQTGFQIDGVSYTPLWEEGSAPTTGFANSANLYDIQITKGGYNGYTVIESLKKLSGKI